MAGSEIIFDINWITRNVQFLLAAILQVHQEHRVQGAYIINLKFLNSLLSYPSSKEDVFITESCTGRD